MVDVLLHDCCLCRVYRALLRYSAPEKARSCCRWATVLPIDAAKTRLQTATPGSPRDVGVIRNLQMMYREGEPLSLQIVHCGY